MNIRDIAERAGYGVSTVSRVINGQSNVSDQARERILAVMDACGYEPNTNARYLKMRSPSPVAVFVMGTSNRLFGDILARIQARFWALGEEVAVTHLEDDANEVQFAISYQQTRHPKAMLFLGGERTYFREAFGQITVPSVLITNTAEGLGFENLSSVTIDNEAAAARAIDYLHAAGHRRIGILGGTRSPEQIGGRRLEGAESALMAHGIVFSRDQDYEPCDFTEEAGYRAIGRLLWRSPDLTAVLALGDVIAFGAIRAIYDRGGSVPGTLSIMGFDGTALSRYSVPRITTVRQDTDALADRSVDLLLQGMQGPAQALHELAPFDILEQESVGASNTSGVADLLAAAHDTHRPHR